MSDASCFLVVVAIFVVCDYGVFKSGVNSFFWSYETEEEKALQAKIIESRSKP